VPASEAPQKPRREGFQSDEEFTSALKEFHAQSQAYWASDRGLGVRRLQREYRGMFASDGTFRIEDVPPGEYTIQIHLSEPPRRSSYSLTELARLETDVAIPSATGEPGDAAFDLGLLQLNPVPQPSARK
jgi:hypothetical protein